VHFGGGRLYVWGGINRDGDWQNGGAFWDPETRIWTALPTAGQPETAGAGAIAWTGKELLIWGGWNSQVEIIRSGAAYEPSSNSWRPISTEGAPPLRDGGGLWTGTELIIMAGLGPPPKSEPVRGGWAYDPETDRWRTINDDGLPYHRGGLQYAWTGTELFAWRGTPECPFGGLYDPETDSWSQITQENAPTFRSTPAFWTGEEILMYGGHAGERNYFTDVVTFDPDG
jgi:N-acetylneuraminic acid mutarotase